MSDNASGYQSRISLYKQLEEIRQSRVITYVTGDRQGLEAQIADDVLDFFTDHLDEFGTVEKITLVLHSRGGQTLAGWTIANLIRQFCETLEVVVPAKALSAATLISLGADTIIMTRQAQLGPIDPSVNGPLNPRPEGAPPGSTVPVSVEAVASFLDLAKEQWGIAADDRLAEIFLRLSDAVHPLTLGDVYRARTQIQWLARRLLLNHMQDEEKISRITTVLCSESGSHDYTITRQEARDELGLPVERPDDKLYQVVRDIHRSFRNELELNMPYNPVVFLGESNTRNYHFVRGLVESTTGGSHRFISEGTLSQRSVGAGEVQIGDQRRFEAWRHEAA